MHMYKHMDMTPDSLQRSRPARLFYDQIADLLRAGIERLHMGKGAVLPNMVEMAQSFGVHRHTIRQAMDILEREGIVDTRKGHDIVVTKERA